MKSKFNLTGTENVKQYPSRVSNNIIVSVCVMTYNHENYIKQCLEGILFQQTNFDFEILLGEDDSSDRTREICINYADKYPEKIRLFLHDRRNVIYVNNSPTGRYNFLYNLSHARGKYIAICEGDDYWIDPLKLQKQVDFLEKNPEVGLVHTDCNIRVERVNKTIREVNKKKKVLIPTGKIFDNLLLKNTIRSLTVLFKSDLTQSVFTHKNLIYFEKFKMADYPLWLEISQLTNIGYINDSTAIYRLRNNSASNHSNIKNEFNFKQGIYDIRFHYIEKFGCREEIKKYIDIDFYRFKLQMGFALLDAKMTKKYYSKLKQTKSSIPNDILMVLGSKAAFLKKMIQFYLRVKNKIASMR